MGKGALAAVLAWALAGSPAESAPPTPPLLAQQIKAAYLDKLGEFVEWPAGVFSAPSDPARLCVAGDDPFGGLLTLAVRGQRIGTHPILLVRLDRIDPGAPCHIVFAAGSSRQSVADMLDKLRGAPVLTVTDSGPDPASRGMVNFVLRTNRVRFEIDLRAATESGLLISSKLLSLAVKPED